MTNNNAGFVIVVLREIADAVVCVFLDPVLPHAFTTGQAAEQAAAESCSMLSTTSAIWRALFFCGANVT
jgi:hypothetical protein